MLTAYGGLCASAWVTLRQTKPRAGATAILGIEARAAEHCTQRLYRRLLQSLRDPDSHDARESLRKVWLFGPRVPICRRGRGIPSSRQDTSPRAVFRPI